jgi:murein DD-endopeptidase MepM/ murein hydrolase activator NlpD
MADKTFKYHVISTNAELITSPFGWRTLNGVYEHHDGIDFVDANRKEKVSDVYINAFADGKVVLCGYGNSVGNYVDLLHSGNILTRYHHMKNNSVRVTTGQQVKKGDILGIMGTTGYSTGIHLHFGVKENSTFFNNGSYVDPMPYFIGEKAIIASSQPPKIIPPAPTPNTAIKAGDWVTVKDVMVGGLGKLYDGGNFKVYYSVYDVIQVSGNRVVIGIGKTVTAAVNANILIKL